jgi:hypothetical protein
MRKGLKAKKEAFFIGQSLCFRLSYVGAVLVEKELMAT